MKISQIIKIKAFFLLLVFSLNSLVSFACSVGIDMGYNSRHHNKPEMKEPVHHCCEKSKTESSKEQDQKSGADDDCCTNSVISFQQMAKNISQPGSDLTPPVFADYHEMVVVILSLEKTISSAIKLADYRMHQQPPPDIRVSIRSFQI